MRKKKPNYFVIFKVDTPANTNLVGEKDNTYDFKEDILKTVDKINELVDLETKEEEYKMFTEKELTDLFNSCLEYINQKINEVNG